MDQVSFLCGCLIAMCILSKHFICPASASNPLSTHCPPTVHPAIIHPQCHPLRVVKVQFSSVLSNNFVNPKPNLPFSSRVFLNLELNHTFSSKDVQFRFSEV